MRNHQNINVKIILNTLYIMKTSVLFFFLGALVVSAQINDLDYRKAHLKGDVKAVFSVSFYTSGDGKSVKANDKYRGDEVEFLNTLSTYNDQYQTTYKEFTYNGNLAKYIYRSFDEKGHRSETIEYDEYESPLYIRTHTCDDLGRVVTTKVCAANEDYCVRTVYYDYSKPNTRIIKMENDAGDPEGSYLLLFDDRGNKIRQEKRDADDNLLYAYTYTYDAKNHLIKSVEKVTTTFSYNDKGDCISQKICEGSRCEQRTYTYIYDSTGNWVGRTTYINKKAAYFTEREIMYY